MRSKTHGAINSSSVLWNSADVSHSPRLDISHLANDSPRSNSILQKARNLIGKPKLDTTRTDYFLLKSRGIDPDTPIVPLTNRKRSREEAQLANKIPVSKALKPTRESRPSSPITNLKEADPRSDEALFARVRQVREAMAEGISWYRAERVKHRLSAASSKISSPRAETEKEKRLREFQFTPSRTEQRLRKTGANGILSKVWNGMSGIRSASSRREAEEHAMPNFGNDPSVEHVNVEDANLEDTNVDDASAENENGQKIKNEEGRDKENDEEDNLEYDEEDYEGGEGGDEGEGGEEEDDDDDEEDGDEDEDAEWSGQNNRWDESAAPPQFKSDLLSKGGSAEDAIEL